MSILQDSKRKGVWENVTTNNPVDQYVGRRMLDRRTKLRFSKRSVAQRLGISSPQYAKYELGTNRISASRLYDLANVLSVPLGYFFDEIPKSVSVASPAQMLTAGGAHHFPSEFEDGALCVQRQTDDLLNFWHQLPESGCIRVLDLVRWMVDSLPEGPAAVAGVVRTDFGVG